MDRTCFVFVDRVFCLITPPKFHMGEKEKNYPIDFPKPCPEISTNKRTWFWVEKLFLSETLRFQHIH